MTGLVLGSNGQVGNALKSVLPGAVYLERGDLDLEDVSGIREEIVTRSPTFIVNAAAYTAVDAAENDEELATRINGVAVVELASVATELNIPFVHISTDYVFSGSASVPYDESDPTDPINAYGRSKLVGESPFIEETSELFWCLRCSWVFSEYGANFVKTMLRLAETETLRVVSDQIGRPTYAGDIASVIGEFLDAWKSGTPLRPGLYHCASSGEATWYEIAVAIFEQASMMGMINRMPKVDEISTEEYPTPAARPAYSVLNTSKLENALGHQLPNWQDGLERTLRSLRAVAS